MSELAPAPLTLKRQPAGTGALIAALEHGWREIANHHSDLPAAQVIVGRGSSPGRGRGLLLGHLAPDRWQPAGPADELVHELLIAGEGLALGADEVFTTVLHEAAHALAITRQIADTSRDGRYHNRAYKTLAEELGLDVTRDRALGWSTTTMRALTRHRYTAAISAITAAITSHRLPEPAAATGRNLAAALCGCKVPRRIRVAQRTLAAGAITCELCGHAFTVAPGTTDQGERETAR
jgi:hypothetical protein